MPRSKAEIAQRTEGDRAAQPSTQPRPAPQSLQVLPETHTQLAQPAKEVPQGIKSAQEPPKKRRRKSPPLEADDEFSALLDQATPTADGEKVKHAAPAGKKYISSLFSSMPEIREPVVQTQPRPSVLTPSNAPTLDGSFESLGISSVLSKHLTSEKMNLQRPTTIQQLAVPFFTRQSQSEQRDAILRAQTGSGKTLAYLLPILQDLMALSNAFAAEGKTLDRSVGTLAIIIVPTRELANQICEVATKLLSFASERSSDQGSKTVSHRWLIPGLLSGGAHRQHEKARLRKGVPLLVATPGRLIDHLQTTRSFRLAGEPERPKQQSKPKKPSEEDDFDIEDRPYVRPEGAADDEDSEEDFTLPQSRSYRPRKPMYQPVKEIDARLHLRWLVLDEADRLMDMGFEPQITSVLEECAKRQSRSSTARRTILCSATMADGAAKLATMALRDPLLIKGDGDAPPGTQQNGATVDRFAPPSQLTQSYIMTAPKLRFVCLVALLRQIFTRGLRKTNDRGKKVLVFMTCTDAVNYHWTALGGLSMERSVEQEAGKPKPESLSVQSQLLGKVPIFRLHGNLELATRLGSLKAFSESDSGILLCTSLAARGLDVPFVSNVIQYDLPTEGGATEYIHRVGRTARAGNVGEAWAFVLPTEAGWVDWVQNKMKSNSVSDAPKALSDMREVAANEILSKGFGGEDYETRATDVQMNYERWVESKPEYGAAARKAFTSHVRAYATHPSEEKAFFHVKNLHLGHLAKAFGLRDAPAGLGGAVGRAQQEMKTKRAKADASDDEPEMGKSGKPMIPRSGRALDGGRMHAAKAGQIGEFAVGGASMVESMLKRKR
ncbi:hypothetical protein E5Q_06619 [Mixia osmundae IAM 14324]|uniref:ATP-dependent RNA helicase n=1 Tax=Mixia osmundae (strain CBS 9802 / IAM 14324 / JCM 22182 / KY 12970) TaxID=764103 RepID=G7EAQ6_MIXOS|nr:hypothetical protein E5Q_06619 [Mixia osmundae IAM 14324]